MASLMETVARIALSVTGRVSPDTAGLLAFKLFSRVPPPKPQCSRDAATLQLAAQLNARARKVRLVIADCVIATHVFDPNGGGQVHPTVLLVHGYGCNSAHMLALAEALCTDGCRVVCLDLPGHGASTGRRMHLGLAVEAIDAAWRQFGPFNAMVGHSLGGSSILAAAAGAILGVPPRRPERLVMIASPVALPKLFGRFANRMGLSPAARAVFDAQVLAISGRPLSYFQPARMLAGVPVPTLIVHAADDREVPFASAETLAAAGPHVTLVRADGFGHHAVVSATPTIEAVTRFLATDLAGPAADAVRMPK